MVFSSEHGHKDNLVLLFGIGEYFEVVREQG